MKVLRFTLLLLLVICIPVLAQTDSTQTPKDTVRIGVFVNSLYDFDIENRSFVADFWIWYNYRNDSLKVLENTELPGSKEYAFTYPSNEKVNNINWSSQKCKATIKKVWNVVAFPFDEQELVIKIEEASKDTSELIYTADTANSRTDSTMNLMEWEVERFSVVPGVTVYNTSYGNPELNGSSSYANVTARVLIKRSHSWTILMKMVTGVYVAFFIATLALFIGNTDRFGLCVGGLFAAIGNKYIVESVVPSTTSNTLIDNIHNLTFVSILVIVLISVISMWKRDTGKVDGAKKLDRNSFIVITSLYVIINLLILFFSLRHIL